MTIRRSSPGVGNTDGGNFILEFANCHGWVLDGQRVGETRDCGLRVMYATNASTTNKDSPSAWIKFNSNSSGKPSDTCRISYIEVDGGWFASNSVSGNGIGLSTGVDSYKAADHPTQWQESIEIDHFYVQDCEGEGMYIGSNWYNYALPSRKRPIATMRTWTAPGTRTM